MQERHKQLTEMNQCGIHSQAQLQKKELEDVNLPREKRKTRGKLTKKIVLDRRARAITRERRTRNKVQKTTARGREAYERRTRRVTRKK